MVARRSLLLLAIVLVLVVAMPVTALAARSVHSTIMTGGQEAPPGSGDANARGGVRLLLDPDNSRVCFRAAWLRVGNTTADVVNRFHIHEAPVGVDGPIHIALFEDASFSPTDRTAACVTADPAAIQEVQANPDGFYCNLHSNQFPDGAIRGQLM